MKMKRKSLYPECDECGKQEGIARAVVTKKPDSSMYQVKEYFLACGHTKENPEAEMEEGIVELFKIQDPELIEIV
jgi:uncharacterized Zn finger protein